MFVACTDASGTTAPVASETMPLICAVCVWAEQTAGNNASKQAASGSDRAPKRSCAGRKPGFERSSIVVAFYQDRIRGGAGRCVPFSHASVHRVCRLGRE